MLAKIVYFYGLKSLYNKISEDQRPQERRICPLFRDVHYKQLKIFNYIDFKNRQIEAFANRSVCYSGVSIIKVLRYIAILQKIKKK